MAHPVNVSRVARGCKTNGTFIDRIGLCDIRSMRSQPSQQVMEPAKSQATDLHSLESFLVGRGEAPGPDLLRRSGLAGWAYTQLPREHPLRPQLRRDYLAVQAHHLTLKREFLPLINTWRRAGIEVTLFKGFWLAETVFPAAGARLHGDVDVLLRPSQVKEAGAISRKLGWIDHPGAMDRPYSHTALNLCRPSGQCWVNAHRFVLHSRVRWNQTQRRITDAVWSWSRAQAWEGMDVRELDPTDAVLVLMLQRCWGDEWRLRPTDWLDLRQLIEVHSVTRGRLLGRAYALGCARTVLAFLDRCDPWRPTLDLRSPTQPEIKQFRRTVFTERPLLAVEPWLARVPRMPGLLIDVLRVLPSVFRAGIAVRRRRAISEILQQLTPLPNENRSNLQRRVRTVCGVRWAVRLLDKREGCLLRSLALYRALRLEGWPVTFVSGLRRGFDGPSGHAWVEMDGRVLPELEPRNTLQYVVAFRYPSPAVANTIMEAVSAQG